MSYLWYLLVFLLLIISSSCSSAITPSRQRRRLLSGFLGQIRWGSKNHNRIASARSVRREVLGPSRHCTESRRPHTGGVLIRNARGRLLRSRVQHRGQHHAATEAGNCGDIKWVAPGKGPLRTAKWFALVKIKRTVNVVKLNDSTRTS